MTYHYHAHMSLENAASDQVMHCLLADSTFEQLTISSYETSN